GREIPTELAAFGQVDLQEFTDYVEAYHAFMIYLVAAQVASTRLILAEKRIQRIFVDGGFSKNNIFMNLLAKTFGNIEIYAASMAQSTAICEALVKNDQWNRLSVPSDIIELRYFRA